MDELTLLRSARSDIEGPNEAVLVRGREALLERADAEGDRSHVGSMTQGRRSLRFRLVGAGIGTAAAAAIVTGLVVTNVFGFAAWRGGAEPAAADALHSAALAAIETSDPIVAEGQYLLVDTTAVLGATTTPDGDTYVSYLTISDEQLYVPADRTDPWVWSRSLTKPYETFGPESERAAEERWQEAVAERGEGSRELVEAAGGDFYSYPSPVGPAALAALPRDPQKLLNHIYEVTRGTGRSADGEALVYIAELLHSGVVPADLRAALYEAVAGIPGVEITEKVATLDGQVGMSIGRVETADNTRQDIIIDPTTGLFIGEREVNLEAAWGFPANTATKWTSVRTSVVDDAPSGGTPNGYADLDGCTLTAPGQFQCPASKG
ncbi:MAG TPA: CU044_5270 family protein [Pseudolysinimonas sp.]|nr:CU044_5270 family protein [Pseudolysinimonas sp.]